LLVNIGRTHQKLGRPQQAMVSYKRFLETDNGSDPALRKKALAYIDEAEKAVSEQQAATKSSSSDVKTEPAASASVPPASLGPGALTPERGATPDGARLDTLTSIKEAPRPIYKKWWFWVAIGGAAAAVAGGVAAGVVVSRPATPIEIPIYQPAYR
jgi:hypothetical protein